MRMIMAMPGVKRPVLTASRAKCSAPSSNYGLLLRAAYKLDAFVHGPKSISAMLRRNSHFERVLTVISGHNFLDRQNAKSRVPQTLPG